MSTLWLAVCWAVYPLYRFGIWGRPYGWATGRYGLAAMRATMAGRPAPLARLPHAERPPWPMA